MSSDPRPSLLAQYLEPVESDVSTSGKWHPFLTFHLHTRVKFSMRYEQLLWVIHKPGDEVVLRYSSHSVRLRGRHLQRLCEEIRSLTARDIFERDDRYDIEESTEPVVLSVWLGQTADADKELEGISALPPE